MLPKYVWTSKYGWSKWKWIKSWNRILTPDKTERQGRVLHNDKRINPTRGHNREYLYT